MLLHGFGLGEGFCEGHSGRRGQAMCRWWCASEASRRWSKYAVMQGELVDARTP